MRVLKTEAVQDPTKVEAHVRAQMEERKRFVRAKSVCISFPFSGAKSRGKLELMQSLTKPYMHTNKGLPHWS